MACPSTTVIIQMSINIIVIHHLDHTTNTRAADRK